MGVGWETRPQHFVSYFWTFKLQQAVAIMPFKFRNNFDVGQLLDWELFWLCRPTSIQLHLCAARCAMANVKFVNTVKFVSCPLRATWYSDQEKFGMKQHNAGTLPCAKYHTDERTIWNILRLPRPPGCGSRRIFQIGHICFWLHTIHVKFGIERQSIVSLSRAKLARDRWKGVAMVAPKMHHLRCKFIFLDILPVL